MKNYIITPFLVVTSLLSAQKVIVEDTYEKKNKPVSYSFSAENKSIVIFKGTKIGGLVVGSKTNNIYSYDFDGNKTALVENEELYESRFSPSHKTLRVYDISEGVFKAKVKYLVDNKFSKTLPSEGRADLSARHFPYYANFTDKSTLKLVNQINKTSIDFEKDNLKLAVTDNFTAKSKSYPIEKPNVARLIGANLVQPKKKLGLKSYINKDDSFYFITKSITSDYTKCTIYKNTYSTIDGKAISEVSFKIDLKDKALVYSENGGGFTDSNTINNPNTKTSSSLSYFDDDLSINNFITDQDGNYYFYGLYSDTAVELNKDAQPKGYYVFKFDKEGNKIWETVNKIEDKDFNGKHYMYYTETDLSFINDKLCFYAFVNEHDEYLTYTILNKDTGAQEKTKKVVFHEYMSRVGIGSDFFKLNFEYKDIKELKNKKFDVDGIIAYDHFPKFAEYVKNVKIKGETHFSTIFSAEGMLVVETDNELYYKVLLF